jgi:hypothetical protein
MGWFAMHCRYLCSIWMHQSAADLFAAEMRIPEQPHRTCAEVLGGCEPLCRCAQAALNAKFGAIGTMELPKEGFCAMVSGARLF